MSRAHAADVTTIIERKDQAVNVVSLV